MLANRYIRKWRAYACSLLAFACMGCTVAAVMQPDISPGVPDTNERDNAVYEVAANEYITLRETPKFEGKELARLAVGERMVCLDFEGIFMKVKTEQSGLTGYVHGGFVKRVDAYASSIQAAIVPNDGDDYTYARMKEDFVALHKAYPGIFSMQTLAQTADNRDIVLCVVGDPDAEYKILITAAIHGREHMTALLLMKLMEQYLSSVQNGQAADYQNVVFYVIPMLNPDGVTISQLGAEGIENENLRAKVERIIEEENTQASLWKSNANGVDLNRNFPVDWDSLYKRGPSATRYRGDSPLCEAETKAIETLMNAVAFDATVSYHATGSVQYWQYKQEGALLESTRALAQAVYQVTKYPLATSEAEEDLEGGGLRDWALMHLDIPSVTVEIGCLAAPLEKQEWTAIYQRNSGLFAELAAFMQNTP